MNFNGHSQIAARSRAFGGRQAVSSSIPASIRTYFRRGLGRFAHGARVQGGSTISMQVARSFFFNSDRTLRRKIAETMVALELERRFTKAQIFELYANEIYLGNRGSFSIHGFGQASLAYSTRMSGK